MAAPGPENENDDFIMVVAPVSKRERKVTSVMEDPMSPSSSSTSKDDTDIPFEPTIEMMVNDFDDEQTLNEEEALSIEEGAEEEIDTLKQESEMPLEELLAKYTLPPIDFAAEPPRKKTKKSSGKKKHKSRQRLSSPALDEEKQTETYDTANKGKYDTDIPGSSEEKEMIADDDDDVEEDITKKVENVDLVKVRRSHLLELYPEGTFGNVVSGGKGISF